MDPRRVLVIYLGDLRHIARVVRQAGFLANDYDVVVAAFRRSDDLGECKFLQISGTAPGGRRVTESLSRILSRQLGRYELAYWKDGRTRAWQRELATVLPVDAILINDLFALPVAFAVGEGAPVVFDAHEHWTSESSSWSRLRRMSMRGAHEWALEAYAPRLAGLMTVSPGLVDEYRQHTGLEPVLVTNAPPYHELSPTPVGEPIKLVHVGFADRRRRLEDTIEAVRLLGAGVSLDLVLTANPDYRHELERFVTDDANIRILPSVAASEVIPLLNGYDVGVHLLPPSSPNLINALPNKLFDYLQARLAVAIGPSPQMARVVREWDCGVVSSGFAPDDFADALMSLSAERIGELKRNADHAARTLNAEQNRAAVLEVVNRAIDGARARS